MINLRAVERDDLTLLKDMRNTPELKKYFREYRLLNDKNQEQWFDSLTNDRKQCMFCIVINVYVGSSDSTDRKTYRFFRYFSRWPFQANFNIYYVCLLFLL